MYYQPILLSALTTIGSVTALAIPPGQQGQQGQPGQQQRHSTPTIPDTRIGTPQFSHVAIQIPSPNHARVPPSNIGPHDSATTPSPQLTVPMGGQAENDADKHVRRAEQEKPDAVGLTILRAMVEKEKQIKGQQQHGHERRGEDVDADEQEGEENNDDEEPDFE